MSENQEKQGTAAARGGRLDWGEWLWVLLPLAGGALLVPWDADWPDIVVLVPLWLMGGGLLFVLCVIYAALAFAPQAMAWKPEDARWTARRDFTGPERWLRLIAFDLGLVVAPLVGGYPMLAGCFAIGQVMAMGMPDRNCGDAERDPDRPRRVGKAIFWTLISTGRLVGWCLSRVAWILFLPLAFAVGLVDTAFTWFSRRRLARRLRSAFDVPGGAVYFVYAEQHQFDRFLGPGGVLQSAVSGVIARNWREDIQPGRSTRSKTPLVEPERSLLRNFKVSNMRDHLPFAVVIAADDRLHPFYLSEPYRKRLRDGGAALNDIENRLRLFIAVAD